MLNKDKLLNIEDDQLDEYLQTFFKRAPHNYPENVKRLIKQSIMNLRSTQKGEEYSQYCFPALRALEGHIKYVIVRAGGKMGHSFSTFQKDPRTGKYRFDEKVHNHHEVPYIEKCYNYYKSVRDTVVHFGDIIGNTDTTRMIESKDDADEIIIKCINLIKWN